jgi:hypothetical protein
VKLLAAHSLKDHSDRGFLLVERSPSSASFRFFARTSVVVTKLDADGNPSYDQVETLGVSSFSIVSIEGAILLRAENPGKTLRILFNTLGQIVGLGFTATPIIFEKYAPKGFLRSLSTHRLINLKVRGTILGTSLCASMEFDSKDGLIAQQLPLPRHFEYQVTQAVYEIKHKLVNGQIGYFANGTVRVAGELSLRLVELVEEELAQLKRRANLFKP